MIIFVGSADVGSVRYKNTGTVGSESYSTLLEWINSMSVDINNVVMCDIKNVSVTHEGLVVVRDGDDVLVEERDDVRVIAFGPVARDYLLDLNLSIFYLPIPKDLCPSGDYFSNSHITPFIENLLRSCEDWIYSSVFNDYL